ncbi:MAG: sulfite exporter TauE/SafE family protein [Meiothermus sp.]|uniref:sulfite exporter TauE/SafE family protein n=1 Tax=Meiothermus sp. TaxID=1955249 RepID=UPI0025EEC763|nr:sulfite exporter TauE/SafE family protein [Meiothermus sp.]MCS7068425.1 sulfite exporter TauE/SafE family protein [Meiothermus sp.]MDW8425222.1 sulfite exporter TauE/SafE family protein [Meiothermus sp.]
MDLSPQAWAIAFVAAWLVGASKTGLSGAVTIAVVLFASILPAREATGALLPVLICADFIAVGLLRRNVRWQELLRIFPWTAVGVGLGTVVLYFSNDAQVQWAIGAIILGMTSYQLYRKARRLNDVTTSAHPAFAPMLGVAAGLTTMVANAAGPFVLIYMLAMRMGKLEVVGSLAWYFLVVNLFKVPFAVGLGLITWESLAFNLWLLPAVGLGAWAGRRLLDYLRQDRFEWMALGLAWLGGLRLLLA